MARSRKGETPEAELLRWERLSRMFNPEWSPKAKMYARYLEAACSRIRLLEDELFALTDRGRKTYDPTGEASTDAALDSGVPDSEVDDE